MQHRIQVVLNTNTIAVTPPLAYPLAATQSYRVMRAPRTMADDPVKLPEGTFIDMDTNAVFGNATPPILNVKTEGTGHVDILFAPNGTVISKGVANSNIHLWVRAAAQDQPANVFRGDPTLVSVFVRTGFVGAFQVDPVTANPYTHVK